MPLLRPWTPAESLRALRLGVLIRDTIDRELGELWLKLAGGDDTVFPQLHDRLTVCGRPELADRLRELVCA